jgi:integrase
VRRKGITVGRRNNGEGSIQKRKDGRWCGRYTVNGKRKYVYGKTRKEVAEKLFKVISESKASFAFDFDGKILLKDHMSNWLENSVRASVSIRTYERREEITRLHIISSLGGTKLKDLSPNHVQCLYREKLNSGLSPRSVKHIHCTWNKALNEAVRWRVIPYNVCGLVSPPRCPDEEMNVLTSKQGGRLLDVSKGDRFEALYSLAVTTGMRRGELLGLHHPRHLLSCSPEYAGEGWRSYGGHLRELLEAL